VKYQYAATVTIGRSILGGIPHAPIHVACTTHACCVASPPEEPNELSGGYWNSETRVCVVGDRSQDLKDAMTAAEISESLGLHHVTSHNWHLQACCALTGEGLYEGLGWIAQQVKLAATPSIAMPA